MNYTFSPHRATLRWSPTFNRFVLPFVLSFLSVLPLTAAGALYAQEAAADAEAEEDTTVDPTEAFLNSFDPSKSFSKLLLPNVAERVGLTKDQTAEVNRLMAERATKLGQASRDQWPDIVRENEAALKAVLTPAQLSLFDVTRTEQKIVLRFSKERWADVLKWIAGELGMQLVMDAPPPGTFTYVDKTEYSPKEALDILCGVLQLKGYTLVRQNENLFLHDLKKGPIPLQLVPKITPLQLPAQSPNDIVQLTMPLGGRASSSALSVAKQFLGPYGSAEIAPSSGYLTVTDTVHALREILPAVLAIPVSTKPSSSPLWADYPLTNVEPAVVKEQIEHFLPTAKPLVNPASRTISFLALPSEQTIIAGIIHRLEAGGDPTREMTFAMYDLSDLTATSQQELAAYSNRLGQSVSSSFYQTRELELGQTIVDGFQKIAPSATITLNPISRQLIVFALPEDQQRIKEAVEQLRKPLTEEEKPQFALYRLQEKGKALSTAEITALKTLIPRGDMTFDAEKGTLLVVAPKEDQEKISQAVEGLNADYLSQDSQKSFVFYMMTGRQLSQFDSLFRAIAETPEMKGVIPVRDAATRRLSIWATKEQHARIQEIVDQITGQMGAANGEGEENAEGEDSIDGPVSAGRSGLYLETVKIEKGNLASYAQVLTSLFSGLEVNIDSVSRSIIVCGAREDVIAARQTIEKLTQGEDFSTKVIPFAGSVSPDALQAFQRSQPLVTIITDQKAKQLILIGPFQGVEQVSKGLEVVLNQEERGTSQTAKTYMPKFVEGSTLTKIVSELFPTLEVSSGENNRIIIRGAVEKVEDAIKTIEGVDIKEEGAVKRSFAAYSVRTMSSVDSSGNPYTPRNLVSDLQKLVPAAKVTYETYGQQIIVWGTEEEHEIIRQAIGNLNEKVTILDQFLRYQIRRADPTLLTSTLQQIYPRLKVQHDAPTNSILVQGNPTTLEEGKALLEMLDPEEPSPFDPTAAVYPFENEPSSAAVSTLRLLAPKARIEVNVLNRCLVVVARPAEHKIIEDAIQKLEGVLSTPEPVLAFYPYEASPTSATLTALTRQFPLARITDMKDDKRLMVIAPPQVQKKVADALGLIAENTKPHDPVLKIYKFREKLDRAFTTTLQSFAPGAKLTLDTANRQLTVVAPQEDIDKIEAQLPMLVDSYADRDVKMIAYTAKGMALETLQSTLAGLHPSVTIKLDTAKKRLLIWGTAAEHAAIAEEIDTINAENDAGAYEGPKVVVYRMDSYRKTLQLSRVVKTMFPNAELIPDQQDQTLMIFATGEEHERIKEVIAQIDNPANENASVLDRFYRYEIKRAASSLLKTSIAQAYPQLNVSVDTASNSLLIQGNPSAIEGVKQFLDVLDPEQPTASEPTVAVYPLESEPSSAALATLRLMAPKARIEVNPLNRSLVVVARPSEHKVIEETIQKIGGAMAAPEPVLAFYPYQTPPTSATLTILSRQAPLARITDLREDKKLMVVAPPLVQEKVSETLGLIAENTTPHDPILKIYKFREKLDSTFTSTLQSFAPNAKLTLDAVNRQLTVVAQQDDIDKIEAQLPTLVDSYADRDRKMIAYTAKGMALETLQSTIAGFHPTVTIKLDPAKKRLLIWGTAAEHAAIAEEIDRINAENDAGAYEGPKFVVYRMDNFRKSLQLTRVVKTMFPNAELIPDTQDQSMMIFATGEEHQQIKEIVDQIDNPENENASVFDRFFRYEIKRAAASLLSSTLAQVYPQLKVSVDSASHSLLIQGNPNSIESVKQFLEMLDPEEPSPSDPTVVVYPLEHEPSSAALATLRLMAPSARIEVNSLNRSLVVVARPAEHKIIEETIRKIGGALEATEPVLAFYPYQTPPSTVTMSTLASLAPTARITDLKDDKKLMVVALPLVQKKVAEILGLIAENTKENDPVLKIYTFREKLDSAFTATLQTFAPNAKLTLDTANRQLTVVAQPEDIDKIEAQLPTLVDSYADRDRKMIAYTIKGMDLETLQSTLAGLYPSVTIKSDPAKKRLLIWGTAADHATIAEEIDKINAEHQAGPYDGPKIVVYQVEDYRQSLQLTRIVKTMFPDAEVIPELTYYSSYSAREQSVTIFASQEEHQRIAELIEQLENPSNEGTLTLDTFSFGKLDPAAVESTLRAMLPAALSGSPLTLRQSAPSASYGQTARQTFFRVDPDSRTVSVYAKPKDVERVREGIEQMAKASEERPQVASKVFPLSSPIAAQLARPLQERLPQSTVTVSSPAELIVFGTTDDLAKAEEFLKGVDTTEGAAETRRFAPVTIPPDSLYPRAALIEQLTASFSPSGGYAYPGASGNQIVLYGTNRMIERMTEYLEACASAKEKEYYQTYPVKNLSVAIVIDMLHRLCPNATITPNGQNRMITVFGSVFVQKQVEEALSQIDVQRADGNQFEIRYYEIGSLPTSAYGHIYHIVYTYMVSQTPQASMIPDIGGRQIVVVATHQEQEAISQFVETTLRNFEANAPSLEVYRLKSVNLTTVSSVLQSVAPSVAIFPGKRSNEFFAWAIPSDHERLRQTLAQIESIDEDGPQGMVPKIYTLDKLGLELILPRLRESIPTAVVYPLAGNRVIVWGSDAEHRLAAELLGVVAEAFPEQTLAKYTPVHVPLTDLYYFIYRKYSPDAVVYLSETGDLVIRAPQVLQEKIAGEIKQFDVPTAEEARPTAKAYDVSSIPTASLSSVIPNILRVVPEAIFLPTQTPGYFVIYARPEAQKKVADLVAEIVKVQPWLKTRTERYTLKNLSQVGAIELLRPLAPAAVMVPGIEHNQLIVSAKEEEHERIAEALEKAAGQGEGNLVNRIYHLERADLTRAQTALLTLYPTEVRCLVDPLARALTVNASPEYQKKVEDFLAEMDRVDEATQPKVETFSLAGLNPTVVMTPLKSFYATDPDFQVHYDTAYRTLVVRGSQKQINFASALIDRVRTGGLSDPTLTFKTYTMRNPWSFYTIRNVFANQGRDLYMFQDYSTGKLLVMARPEEHQVIDEVLTAMAPEKTQLEIFDLVYVDPTTAYNIISTMLENDGSFVDVQYDASSNRLYVRANAHKLEEIRRFLIEAGEKDLEKKGPISDSTSSQPSVTPISTTPAAVGAPAGGDAAPSVTGSGAMRTIRAGGADLRQAVAEVQKQWSLKNPISVLEQGDSVIQTRSDDSAEQQPAEKPAEGSQPAAEKPAEGSEKPAEPPTGAVERVKKWAAAMSIAPVSGAALMEWVPAEQPAGQPAKDQPVEQPAAEQQEVAPGIYAVMGKDGSLMITSSDTEALEKFQEAVLAEVALQRETQEQAQPQSAADSSGGSAGGGQGEAAGGAASFGDEKNVRTLARQNVEAARAKLVMEDKNFSVYKVEEVSVDILLSRLTYYMADRINPPQLAFTPSASSLARGITMKTISSGPRLTFTPDRVLNTIMVKGNKVDRDEAGAMITLLDRPELFPQPITKPFKVPVKNTTVQKMATQVLNAFQQKFITMRLPGNQVPRVSPNTETNTLEIYAPESLAMEIAEYVKETDEEILRDPNRKQVQVVKLQHINSSVLQKYLTSLRASQYQYNFTTPYMFNPNSYYRRVPGQ